LRYRPDYPEALANLGNALGLQGRHDQAIANFRAALRSNPGLAHAHVSIATSLAAQHAFDAAASECATALRMIPGCAEARYCLAMIELVRGRMTEGWRLFEARLELPSAPPRPAAPPAWNGGPLDGRRILVYAEEGHGDTIQFCRYISLLAAHAEVTLQVPTALVRLLAGSPGAARVVDRLSSDLTFDLHCPLLSLPLRFGTLLETIPAATPYLTADPDAVAAWRTRLAAQPGVKVGLAWAGNKLYQNDRQRSIPWNRLTPLAGIPGVALVSLQNGDVEHTAAATLGLLDWTDELNDRADTAALIAGLDLVISVDTAVAHLAGALGRPVWLLNRYDTDWRWLLDRDDSPWYPTLRQFRQPRPGDWDTVLQDVRTRMHHHVATTPGTAACAWHETNGYNLTVPASGADAVGDPDRPSLTSQAAQGPVAPGPR
jgi:hypothetical protein